MPNVDFKRCLFNAIAEIFTNTTAGRFIYIETFFFYKLKRKQTRVYFDRLFRNDVPRRNSMKTIYCKRINVYDL